MMHSFLSEIVPVVDVSRAAKELEGSAETLLYQGNLDRGCTILLAEGFTFQEGQEIRMPCLDVYSMLEAKKR